MRISAAYLGVILIWSTTPLAIKWSGDGPGFLFGATSRMCIGFLCVHTLLRVRGIHIPRERKALQHYGAGALSIYCSMCLAYWAAQQIPSGWMSALFGLSPLITAILARTLLGEDSLTPRKLFAQSFSIGGLWVIYGSAAALGPRAVQGIVVVLVAAFFHALSAVLIKRINANVPALASVAGTLALAVPAYLVTWLLMDGKWPAALPLRSLLSITYLGVIATTCGFSFYFFILKYLSATRVAMIMFATPVLALLAGYFFNHEPLTARIAAGTALILGGLLLHELGRPRLPRLA
ncbi:MAG: DMT family transporter [Gammaproteobacteria bacterium]|nr:DMT family transporter [Gammaproteobacteria bacterium]